MELDVVFLKALKLLHSRSKDSAGQLKQMYYDVVAKKKSNWNGKKIDEDDVIKEKSSRYRKDDVGENKKKEADKRKLEKLKNEIEELNQDSVAAKKPKLDAILLEKEKHKKKEKVKDHSDSDSKESWIREKEHEIARREEESGDLYTGQHSDTDSEADAKDKSVDDGGLDLRDVSCVVCHEFDWKPGNQLVECQECHSLYHQECHKPPVCDKDVQDVRSVWYCSKCQKSMKKIASWKPQKSSKMTHTAPVNTSSSVSSKEHSSTKSLLKTDAAAPFKRTEITKTSSSSSSKEQGSSKQGPFEALSTLAMFSKDKQKSAGSSKQKVAGLDANKPGSFLFADPIRISSSKSSSKSGDVKVQLNASAKAEAAQRSANKPLDHSKFSSLAKSGGSSTKVSSAGMVKSGSTSGLSSLSRSLQKQTSAGGNSSSSVNTTGVKQSSVAPGSASASASSTSSMSVEKRLQMMKKKANAKQMMKRAPIK